MKVDAVNSSNLAPQPGNRPAASVNIVQPSGTGLKSNPDATGASPKLEKAVATLNKQAETLNREVRFAIFDGTHRIMIEVVDKTTNQVVATFPPKQILKMAATMEQDLIDQKKTDSKEVK